MKKNDPFGDGEARVGKPGRPQRDNRGKGSLGAGKEATGGIAKDGDGKTDKRKSAARANLPPKSDQA